jgi:hypothetical protein
MRTVKLRVPSLLALILLVHTTATAQLVNAGSPTGVNAAFVKLFGNVSAFSARMETRVLDHSGKEWVRMPMDFTALDGKVRIDINLEQATSRDLPASTISGLKQAGMSQVVSIFRPDQKATFILYPATKRFLKMPLAKGESEALEKGLQMEKSAVGKEKIDGHSCVKNKVVIKNSQATVLEATTWNAGDLKDLPIQIETKQKDKTVIMRFTHVELAKPDAKQFDVPANYTSMQ